MGIKILRVAEVALDSRLAGSEAVYTYAADADTQVGQARFVPLGPRRTLGYVIAVREILEQELGFPASALRPLAERVEGLDLPLAVIDLLHEVSRQTLTPLSVCISACTPPGVRDRLVTQWEPTGTPPDGLSPAAAETLHALHEKPILQGKGRAVPPAVLRQLRGLEKLGLARKVTHLLSTREKNRSSTQLRLTSDTAKVEEFLRKSAKKKPAQALTVMRLQGSEASALEMEEIKALAQVSEATVKALLSAGLLEPVEAGDAVRGEAPNPNPAQAAAIAAISQAVSQRDSVNFLLYGITGSGKTEVYLRAAEATLREGRQVLYLVPEIALTAQVIAQLRARFGARVAVLHSNQSPGERLESWARVKRGEAPVVLGPRSALFAPLHDLGLIVMDEEHEGSYKQETAPRYHTKRLARFLAARHACPLVLGSATPSVETFWEAEHDSVRRLDLPVRANPQARLPEITVLDLTSGYRKGQPALLDPALQDALAETLAREEQAILFLNRRSYAPFVVCRDCGHRFECPQCSVSLSLHRRANQLRCHQCDHHAPAPEECPQCQGTRLGAFGAGTEKVEEAVAALFPQARVARLDRDIARRKGALEEVLSQFRARELDILVGTQMVAKGLDFPQVTLVGVITADISLNVPDFRASERTFQLLSQVAGRAGRSVRPGRVFFQTLSADHPAIRAAQAHDYEGLVRQLWRERAPLGYPPFGRLVNVVFTGPVRQDVVGVSAVAGQRLRTQLPGWAILGPADCPIERIQNQFRRHIVLKSLPDTDPTPIATVLDAVESPGVRIVIDVDPYSMV